MHVLYVMDSDMFFTITSLHFVVNDLILGSNNLNQRSENKWRPEWRQSLFHMLLYRRLHPSQVPVPLPRPGPIGTIVIPPVAVNYCSRCVTN